MAGPLDGILGVGAGFLKSVVSPMAGPFAGVVNGLIDSGVDALGKAIGSADSGKIVGGATVTGKGVGISTAAKAVKIPALGSKPARKIEGLTVVPPKPPVADDNGWIKWAVGGVAAAMLLKR